MRGKELKDMGPRVVWLRMWVLEPGQLPCCDLDLGRHCACEDRGFLDPPKSPLFCGADKFGLKGNLLPHTGVPTPAPQRTVSQDLRTERCTWPVPGWQQCPVHSAFSGRVGLGRPYPGETRCTFPALCPLSERAPGQRGSTGPVPSSHTSPHWAHLIPHRTFCLCLCFIKA